MKKKNNFINSLMKDLSRTSKYLKEDYIFNGHDDGGEEPMGDEGPVQGPMPQQQQGQMQGGDENAEEKAMHAHEVIQHEPIIQKIRQTAIDGLKKYSEDPTSSIYEFFKKVFLESDKVLTDDGSGNKTN